MTSFLPRLDLVGEDDTEVPSGPQKVLKVRSGLDERRVRSAAMMLRIMILVARQQQGDHHSYTVLTNDMEGYFVLKADLSAANHARRRKVSGSGALTYMWTITIHVYIMAGTALTTKKKIQLLTSTACLLVLSVFDPMLRWMFPDSWGALCPKQMPSKTRAAYRGVYRFTIMV